MKNEDKQMQTIKVRKVDLKKMDSYKVHPNQAYWEIVKKAIEALETKK